MDTDPLEELLKLKQQAAPQGDDPLEALMKTKAPTGHNGVPFVEAGTTERKENRNRGVLAAVKGFASGGFPGALAGFAGDNPAAVANVGRHIPGAEALQSGARAMVHGQPYREAREEIRDAEDAVPGPARIGARLLGGGLAAASMPGGMVRQGATFGALGSVLDSDADRGVGSRAVGAGLGAAVGGTLGAAGKVVGAISRAPSGALGEIAGAAMPSNIRRAAAVVRKFNKTTAPAPKAIPATVEAAAPKVEGLIGNDMSSVVEAIKAQRPASSAVADVVKRARPQAHRTKAQFDNFAERPGEVKPKAVTMESLLAKARKQQPHEPGNQWTDADIAMGRDVPEPDLADLMKRTEKLGSLGQGQARKGGKPVLVPRDAAPAAEEVATVANGIKDKHGLSRFDVQHSPRDNSIVLNMMEVPQASRGKGIGSAAMRDLTDYADGRGLRITLTPARKGDAGMGTTSRSRLIAFYKNLGFVENKGRARDFAVSDGMFRNPSVSKR